jgi:thioredoxin reductase
MRERIRVCAKDIYDVTIIGGGPAGLFSAFYSGLRELKTKIIEFQTFLGGKVNVYPEKLIWDVGGVTPITGEKLIEQMIAQGLTFDPEIVLGEKVTSISKDEDGIFVLQTSSGAEHYSKTVILAVGGGILKPTKLNLEGAERYEVTNLHYTVKSLSRFKDKTVLISGGGNSAIDWANELEPIAKQVYLTYRNETLKGHEAEVSKLLSSSVVCLLNTEIEKLVAAPGQEAIERVVLRNKDDGAQVEMSVDEVIINHGYERDKDLLSNSQVNIEMQNEWAIAGTPMSETSVPGLYAAGDILGHEGKLHLIAGAFQDAANAVNKAKQYIIPEAEAWGMVSSHNEIFMERNRELKKQLFAN